MAYDEELAARVRDAVGERAGFTEIKMFGGLAFMVNTHMACGVMEDGLLVHLDNADHDDAMARGAREFDFTGRPMRGFVVVPADLLAADEALDEWVEQSTRFALAQPPKPPKAPKRPKPPQPRRAPG